MIMVDSSVWIEYFNGVESEETDLLDDLLGKQEVATGDLIMLEVLRGFKADKHYTLAKQQLNTLSQYAMLSPQRAISATDHYRKLRKQGITVRKTADIIIASFCISEKLPLLYADKDFKPFVERLGLQSASAMGE